MSEDFIIFIKQIRNQRFLNLSVPDFVFRVQIGVANFAQSKQVIFKNNRNISYCMGWREVTAVTAIIVLILTASFLAYDDAQQRQNVHEKNIFINETLSELEAETMRADALNATVAARDSLVIELEREISSKQKKISQQQVKIREIEDIAQQQEEEIQHLREVQASLQEEGKIIVWKGFEKIYEPGYYGKQLGDRLEMALVEACLLLKRGRIRVFSNGKQMTFQELYDHARSLDRRFTERYRVYEDLRERGLLVRTGFKFGCDFRVYERGVQLKKGPKSAKEHTQWIVFCVPEDYTLSFQELSRSVRLAHNIRARMLWAVVDNEGDATYYQIVRHKP